MAILPKYVLVIFIAVSTFFLGLLVLKQRRTLPHITGFLLCLITALISLLLLGREWSLDQNRIPLPWNNFFDAGLVFHSFIAVSFALSFPEPTKNIYKVLAPLSFASLTIAGIALTGGNFSNHRVIDHVHLFERTRFYNIYLLYSLSMMTAMIWILTRKYLHLRSTNSDERARKALWIILIGFSTSIVVGYIFAYVLPILLHEIRFFYLLSLSFLIGAITAFYSIVQYNAFDIETVIHKTLSWLFLSSGPLIVTGWAGVWLRPQLAGAPTWQWSISIAGIGCLVGAYLYFAQPYIDQLFDRRRHDLRKAMDEVIRDMAVLQELQPMAEMILDRLCQVLSVESGAAMILDGPPAHFILVGKKDLDMGNSVDVDQRILQRLKTGSILEADQLQARNDAENVIQQWLKSHTIAICFPLVQKGELIGALAFGRKRNLQRFYPRETSFLAQIGTAVTIAFSNSLLLERVRELDRSKTEFLSEVAHELSGPLSGMSSIADGLLSRGPQGITVNQRRMIDNIRVTAVEMKDLVDHLLDLSKIEMGVMRYEFQPVDLGAIVRLAVDLVTGAVRSKGLELQVEISDDLPLIHGDKARIRQCVSNLLSNAIKYTDRGRIHVGCQSEGNGVRFTVEDTGRGMAKEELKTIFERFKRGARVGAIDGSGLGLTLTKQIIEAHGGKIDVESMEELGSRFFISLPVTLPEGSIKGAPALIRFRPFAQPMAVSKGDKNLISIPEIEMGHGETLVVVDDTETERETLRSLLEARGYRIVTATNGLDGLEIIRMTMPQLIITDLLMPKMNGPELCSALKEDPNTASIPIIMVTGRNSLGDMLLAIEMGADDYLAKPYNIQELSVRISALLRMQRIRSALETERQHTDELEKKHHQVNSVLKNKNYLIMQLAHEVKTPLTSLTSMVANLYDEVVGPLSARQKEYLADINGAADRLKRLLTDLLCFAMAEAGTLRLQARHVRVGVIVQQVLTAIQAIGEESRITYSVGESIQEKTAFADPDRLQQILLNLVHNAISASPAGSRVFIDARDEGSDLTISISDSGPGIPKEQQSKILQEPVFSGKSQGGGFGLFITRYLIELHGGRIWFESEEGKGTTFFFTLPQSDNALIKERGEHVRSDSHR